MVSKHILSPAMGVFDNPFKPMLSAMGISGPVEKPEKRWSERSASRTAQRRPDPRLDRSCPAVLQSAHVGSEMPPAGETPKPIRVKEVMPMSSHGTVGITVEVAS